MSPLEALLVPIDGESPAGPDLAYESKRQEIEQAFDAAAAIAPGENDPTDWRHVIRLIMEQGERTRDVWLPVYLARAGARANRLESVELGCQYLAGLFDNFWPTMHPTLEEYGFQGRTGACESLVRIAEFLGPLQRMSFVEHPRLGKFSGDDLERFSREGEAADNYGLFRAAIDDIAPQDLLATIARLDAIRDSIMRVDAVLSAQANGDTGTNFTPTYAVIDSIRGALAQFGPAQAADAVRENQTTPQAAGKTVARPGSAPPPAAIESRDDVLKALDAVVDYYRRREPGSPVPVAIARAKGWVDKDFLTVLEDIAPESLGEAKRVLTSNSSADE